MLVNIGKSVTRGCECLLEYELLLNCERDPLCTWKVQDLGKMSSAPYFYESIQPDGICLCIA